MEKIISNKAASFASMELAKFVLERADLRASSILEQYRKSTDRNYTLTGFIMTAFMALTAFLASADKTTILMAITIPLWAGTGIALLILFCKVIWVHNFMALGGVASQMLGDHNVDVALRKGLYDETKANEAYLHHDIIEAIRHCEADTNRNLAYLHARCHYVSMATTVIIASVIMSSIITVVALALSFFGGVSVA